eukprot:scaffold24_cov128-Cylindrotheca_fusiformis.AAC.30
MKEEVSTGPLGFQTARKPGTDTQVESVQELLDIYLSGADANGHLPFEDNVQVTKKIYPTVDEDTIRSVLSAYQKEVAPDLFAKGMTDIRRSFIPYLYFAPYKSLDEKMETMFVIADANSDGKLSRKELTDSLGLFLKTAASFMPQMEKLMGAQAAQTYVTNLGVVYSDSRIESMVDLCFETAGEKEFISKDSWTNWAKSPENIEKTLGRASAFLTAV